MTTNLEQIAKQVSLLNRLIELLRMQEEPKPEHLDELVQVARELEVSTGAMEHPDDRDNFGENPLKDKSIEYLLKGLLKYINNRFTVHMILRAILNKYGRSLAE